MQTHTFNSPSDMFPPMAAALIEIGTAAVGERGVFQLVLNGGSTPVALFKLLAALPHRSSAIWPRTQFWWGDERSVSPDDPGSNFGVARELLLDPLGIEPSQIRRMKGELDSIEGAVHYTDRLRMAAGPGRAWPRFDLVLLGLGLDGHTASLFPGSVEPPGAAAMAVAADYDGRPAERISLASAVINDARHVFWMVTGAKKADIVKRVLDGPRDPVQIPAQRIVPEKGKVDWWLAISEEKQARSF